MRGAPVLFAVSAVVLLFVAYGPVLTRGPFGINDDYQYLYRTHAGTFDPGHNELVGMGRPVLAWEDGIAYGLCAGRVARLVWLRALSLVGVGVFAWGLFRVLAGLGYGRGFAATVAALVALTPSAGVFAGFAAAMFAPWALAGALAAGSLLVTARGNWWRELAAGVLIVAVCATWQAAAPMVMFPVLFDAWQSNERPASWWRPWLAAGLAVGVYGALCMGIARSGAGSAYGVERLAVVNDPAAKARFLLAVLRCGVTSWARLQVGPLEWMVGVGTTCACLCALTRRRSGLAAGMVFLSVAPLLVAREDNGAFRALICLYVATVFLAVTGVRRLLTHAPGRTRVGLAVLAVGVSAGAARYHVWHGLVEPNLREYTGLRDEARRRFPDGMPPRVVYLVPPFAPLADGVLTPSWEYGLTSSAFWWVTRPFLLTVFADAFPDRPLPLDPEILYREAGNPGVPVLSSLPILLRDEGAWCDDPRWGPVQAFRNGWLYSTWFGYFDTRSFPYIQHHLLGGLLFSSQPKDGGDLWFYHEGLGHFYTRPDLYPRLLLGGENRWVTLSDDHPAQLSLHEDLTNERQPYPPWH